MRGPDFFEQGVDRVGFADVGGVSRSLQIARGQFGGERVEFCLVAADHDDMGAEPREQPGNGAADAAGAARDERDLVLQGVRGIDGRMRRKLRVGIIFFLTIIHAAPALLSFRAYISCVRAIKPTRE